MITFNDLIYKGWMKYSGGGGMALRLDFLKI